MASEEQRLSLFQAAHTRLMRTILLGIADTPLVLKGGTALLLAYGLDRFSEDLDFDAPHKINLTSRIRRHIPAGIALADIQTLKDSATVTRYRVRYQSADANDGVRSLKLEISYRTPAPETEVRLVDGIRVATLPRILDQKLQAAHDGADPRSKVRDLYDLAFLARSFPSEFTPALADRLRAFSANPEAMIARYRADFEEDDLIMDVVALEALTLNLHYAARDLGQVT